MTTLRLSSPIIIVVVVVAFTLSGFLAGEEETEVVVLASETSQGPRRRSYIIHVAPPRDGRSREEYHESFLPTRYSDAGERRLLYSYERVSSGFAAVLGEEEVERVKEKDGVLAVYPDELVPLLTTRSPDFLGLPTTGVWNDSNYGEGVIIGVLDSGVDPDHPSFACDLPPPPSSWKGRCEFGPGRCNNKIIGARVFSMGHAATSNYVFGSLNSTPIDEQGHGTHVASTAAGCAVSGAGAYGQARGTAAGVAPRAYLSIYKVCGPAGCAASDILAGLDASIADGVDIATLSLGGDSRPFYNDPIAVGTFGAVASGIFVSAAGGNSGPAAQTLSNEAPWLLTVAATTLDRTIRATVRLGNGLQFDGETLNQSAAFPVSKQLPLVNGGSCSSFFSSVRGKVVLCEVSEFQTRTRLGLNVLNAGGAAMILANKAEQGNTTLAEPHVLPASHVTSNAGAQIKRYISSAGKPTAEITPKGTITGGPFTAAVAYFSSRGPSAAGPGVLKPDIAGPGVNILAAWPTSSSPFYILSGTSMATPHVAGAAALVKAAHPSWSPAAVRSALMTSAATEGSSGKAITDHLGRPAAAFDVGSGEVNPRGAVDSNVVYEVGSGDYIAYLCGLGYTSQQVSAVAGRSVSCSPSVAIREDELNYPGFRIMLDAAGNFTRRVTRTLTNVDGSDVTCTAASPTGGLNAVVRPATLRIPRGEKKKYEVTFGRSGSGRAGSTVSGVLGWSCGGAPLRTPAVVSY